MKKFFVAALALICSGSAFAIDNEPEEGLTTQIFAGMSASSISNYASNYASEYDGKIGANVGIKFDYMLPNAQGTYISAGLDWIMKGCKADVNDIREMQTPGSGKVPGTNSITAHYIELPVRIGFRYNILPELGVYGEVGPYFSFGVTGYNSFKTEVDGSRGHNWSTATFKKKTNGIQRWDAGVGFRIGCEYDNRYSLNLGCDWGCTDMYTDNYREDWANNQKNSNTTLPKIKNFDFVVAFGYRF